MNGIGEENRHSYDVETTLEKLNSRVSGLTKEEANERLAQYGYNELEEKKKESYFQVFLRQFKSPIIYVLIFAALVAFLLREYNDAIIIAVILIVNSIIGSIPEGRAERTISSLKKLASPVVKVKRNGVIEEIPSREVVPGDLIIFETGDKIPADARLIESVSLKIDEAILTGESVASEKYVTPVDPEAKITEQKNMVFSGTSMVAGHGEAVVVATGMHTQMGEIARTVHEAEEDIPIMRRMAHFIPIKPILIEVELSNQIYPRIKASLIVLLFLMLVVLFMLISINIFGMAFRKLGFLPEYSVYFLFLSLLGNYVNLPLSKIMSHVPVMSSKVINFHDTGYTASSFEVEQSTSIAVNLGGAVIPVLMSLFLSTMVSLVDVLTGILVMTILIHKIARPVKGSGIVIHALLPPFLAAAVAFIISPQDAPILAYVSGTLGCLIGIDVLNLKKIPDLGMPVVSIGGSGTFDAIFLTGIISVLLA